MHRWLSTLLAMLVLTAAQVHAQQGDPIPPERAAQLRAAEQGLVLLRRLATPANVGRFGFTSVGELEADVGVDLPICDYVVSRSQLVRLANGELPSSVLQKSPRVTVPISVGDGARRQVRASLTLARREAGGWEVVAFGGARSIAALTAHRDALAREYGVASEDICIARISSRLHRALVIRRGDDFSFLVITPDLQSRDISPGALLRAADFAGQLIKL